jgi:hypothetical protein
MSNGYPVKVLDMRLDDRKVFRRFKGTLATGHLLPFTIERSAGMIYRQFGKQWKANPIQQRVMLTGVRLRPGHWRMNVPEAHYEKVVNMLLETCQ